MHTRIFCMLYVLPRCLFLGRLRVEINGVEATPDSHALRNSSHALRATINGVEATPADDFYHKSAHAAVSGALLVRASACCSENIPLILAAHWRNLGKKRSTPLLSGMAEAVKRTVRLASTRSCSRMGTLRLISSVRRRGRVVVA